jgi:hypothetical protein
MITRPLRYTCILFSFSFSFPPFLFDVLASSKLFRCFREFRAFKMFWRVLSYLKSMIGRALRRRLCTTLCHYTMLHTLLCQTINGKFYTQHCVRPINGNVTHTIVSQNTNGNVTHTIVSQTINGNVLHTIVSQTINGNVTHTIVSDHQWQILHTLLCHRPSIQQGLLA